MQPFTHIYCTIFAFLVHCGQASSRSIYEEVTTHIKIQNPPKKTKIDMQYLLSVAFQLVAHSLQFDIFFSEIVIEILQAVLLFLSDSLINLSKIMKRSTKLKLFNQKTCEWNSLNFLDPPGPRIVLCSKPGSGQ